MSDDNEPMMGGYLILGLHYWGWGATVVEARAQFKREGGRLNRRHLIYRFPDDTQFHGVDRYGWYSWTGDEPERIR